MTTRPSAPQWPESSKTPAAPTEPKSRHQPSPFFDAVRLDTVQEQETNWLWYPYIPAAKLTVLEGDPGMGKSWISCAIAAAVTTGKPLPGHNSGLPPQKVLLASAEDGIADTIVPRLRSLGADMTRVFAIRDRFVLDKEGVRTLHGSMREFAATILFIDPIVAYIGNKVDMHRANEVRVVMTGLSEAAEATGCAVVIVRHLRKGSGGKSGGKEIYGGIGSIDFTAAARSALLVGEFGGEGHVLRHIKSNNAKKGLPLVYEFSDQTPEVWIGDDNAYHSKYASEGGNFHWGRFLAREDEKPLGGPKPVSRTKADECRDFLRKALALGARPAAEVTEEIVAAGITLGTLNRVKPRVVRSYQPKGAADTSWWWELWPKEKLAAALDGIPMRERRADLAREDGEEPAE